MCVYVFQGQFGEVYRGVFKVTGALVAIKTCRETLCEDVKRKFLQEGRILKQYDHPNIVKFIGIAAQRHPVMIVMEFVSGNMVVAILEIVSGDVTTLLSGRLVTVSSVGTIIDRYGASLLSSGRLCFVIPLLL